MNRKRFLNFWMPFASGALIALIAIPPRPALATGVVAYWKLGSEATLLTTEINSLANGSTAISSVGGTSGVFDNIYGDGGLGGYQWLQLDLHLASIGSARTANTAEYVWFLQSLDGSTFEDGSASVIPARAPDATFPVRAVTGAQELIQDVQAPPGKFYVLIEIGDGQTAASSGNTLKVIPYTPQAQ